MTEVQLERVSLRFLEQHPADAARVIESMGIEDLIPVFTTLPATTAAKVFMHMTSVETIKIFSKMEIHVLVNILELLPANVAAALIRRLAPEILKSILESPETGERLKDISTLLQFAANTAGAIMEPAVLLFQKTMKVHEVRRLLRLNAKDLYNEICVIDGSQVVSGFILARDLLVANDNAAISELLKPFPIMISPRAHLESIVENPAWNNFSHLPVIDAQGVMLGYLCRDTLIKAVALIAANMSEPDPPRDILVGLAETFLNTFSELMSYNKR